MVLTSLLRSKVAVAVLVVVVLGAGVGGAFAAGVLGTPKVKSVDNSFGGVNRTTTTIDTDLAIQNPNPFGAGMGGLTIDYTIFMNDLPMANGTHEGVSIEKGRSTESFTTYMANDRIPAWWVSHIRNGEHTDLTVSADVHSSLLGKSFSAPEISRDVDTDIISAFNSSETRPLNANQEPVVQDPVLYLNSTSGAWGSVTDEETTIEMQFAIYNPKPYPITVSEIGYDISMNDISVGSGSTSHSYTLPPHETTTVEATTTIDNSKLDEWWVSHLRRNQTTKLAIDFYMKFDLSATGGGSVKIPLDTLTKTIHTDFFGTKDGGSAGNGDSGNRTATPDGSATATATPTDDTATASGDGEPTSTATQTATATPTQTATATSTQTATPGDGTTTTSDGGLL